MMGSAILGLTYGLRPRRYFQPVPTKSSPSGGNQPAAQQLQEAAPKPGVFSEPQSSALIDQP